MAATLAASPSSGGTVTKTPLELNSPKPQITGTEVIDHIMRGGKASESEISSDSLYTSKSSKTDKSCGSIPLAQVIQKTKARQNVVSVCKKRNFAEGTTQEESTIRKENHYQ